MLIAAAGQVGTVIIVRPNQGCRMSNGLQIRLLLYVVLAIINTTAVISAAINNGVRHRHGESTQPDAALMVEKRSYGATLPCIRIQRCYRARLPIQQVFFMRCQRVAHAFNIK